VANAFRSLFPTVFELPRESLSPSNSTSCTAQVTFVGSGGNEVREGLLFEVWACAGHTAIWRKSAPARVLWVRKWYHQCHRKWLSKNITGPSIVEGTSDIADSYFGANVASCAETVLGILQLSVPVAVCCVSAHDLVQQRR